MTPYRPPRDCPVCSSRLQVTQLGCPRCGTGLTGSFESCEFCGLDQADRDLLRVFLASRGNMKELERHLGVSYPTARARFEDLLRRLGLSSAAAASAPSGTAGVPQPGGVPESAPSAGQAASRAASGGDPRLDVLRAVATGEVDVEDARDDLSRRPGGRRR